ncbi:MAG: hypothetical protein V8R40_02200 [Dysosmobacter sp.]
MRWPFGTGSAPDYSDYMMELMEITPTSANWREYAAMMHSQATLQRVRNWRTSCSRP